MKRKLHLLLAILVAITPYAQGQTLFFEDFDGIDGPTAGGAGTYSFPMGWLLRNVDNRTPDAQVSYVNEAWERREDFGQNVSDSAAFSTSYYSPVGAADDWMWTPLIGPLPANSVLKWRSRSYDQLYLDAYEVRIMTSLQGPPTGGTGVIGNQVTSSTQLFSTAAESSVWTAHSISLNGFVGQSVYVAFRNNSNDKFVLVVDDVEVSVLINDDISIQSTLQSEYTMTPVSQVPLAGMDLGANVRNNGLNPATNVILSASVFDSGNSLVFSTSSTSTTLAPGASADITMPGFFPTQPDNYRVEYGVSMNAVDQVPTNSIATRFIMMSDAVYSRDNGTVVGSLGIGAGNGGYMGQDFMIEHTASIGAVQAYFTRGYTGAKLAAVIWSMSGGEPSAIVAYTDTITYPDDSARLFTLPIDGGNYTLAPGRYAVTFIEFDSTLALGLTMNIYTPGRTWINWPTSPIGGWANNEDFGPAYERAYALRLIVCPTIAPNLTTVDAICTADGKVLAEPSGGEAPYTFDWSTGVDIDSIFAPAGSYDVTITDNLGCEATTTATIGTSNTAITSTISITQSICNASNGGISVTPTNGTSPYSFLWNDGTSTASMINKAASIYTVSITDANGCSGTNTGEITANKIDLTSTTSSTAETCSGENGSATVAATNGAAPYQYLWSNGGAGPTISNIAAATYNVALSDVNGCTGINTVTVGTNTVVLTSTTTSTQATCTAADGTAEVTVTNGTSPYMYDWSNGETTAAISALTAGTYDITLTDDNGCTGTNAVTVSSNAIALTSTTTSTQATCTAADGTAEVTVTNGTSPYMYDWSNTETTAAISALIAGTYGVTLTDDNGCSGTASINVTANQVVITLTTSSTATACSVNTGTATVDNVANGTAPYDYDWSNAAATASATALAAGSYEVTVTDDNGCSASATVNVPNAAGLSGTATATDATCNGGTDGDVDLSITGGTSPFTFAWSNTATSQNLSNVAAGAYTVTITDDNGCSATATTTITQPTALTVSGISTDPTSGNNGAVNLTVSGGTTAYAFDWSNTATTEDLTGLAAGSYTVTVTDANGCSAAASFTLITVGLTNIGQVNVFTLFPNPASNLVQVQINLAQADDLKIELVDMAGKILASNYAGKIKDNIFALDLSQYASGIYSIRLSGQHTNAIQRLIIER